MKSDVTDRFTKEFGPPTREVVKVAASGVPFLTHTLLPLHTLYRRIGFIYHRHMPGQTDLSGMIDRPTVTLTAFPNRRVVPADAATDALIDFRDTMFEGMESGIDPSLLDCSIEP